MANFRNKYDPVRIFLKRVGTLALGIVVIAASLGVWKVYQKERESRTLREYAEVQRADLEIQAERLREDTRTLKTERGQEEALREQYDVGKRGESLIIIVEPTASEPIQATTTFMQKVKKLFIFW